MQFLSTLSLRRATANLGRHSGDNDFYPRSPCGERPTYLETSSIDDLISIHALLAESDDRANFTGKAKPYFYPRSPCGERQMHALIFANLVLFLSTLSLRRATLNRPPPLTSRTISIHALLAESDANSQQEKNNGHEFLSTLSLRRATYKRGEFNGDNRFLSTLSLRRATINPANQTNLPGNFYPRSPCGERRLPTALRTPHHRFLSTLSLRRATSFWSAY